MRGINRIVEGVVTIDRVYKRSGEALNGDDGIFLSVRLLKAKTSLSERGYRNLCYVYCERGRDLKVFFLGGSDGSGGEFIVFVTRR